MKLMQDSTQKLSTASLLGVGITTNSDGGNSLSNPNKKLMFADDLRQQISEAVATSKSRQLLTSTSEAEARAQHSAYPSNDQKAVVALPSASVQTDAITDPETTAAGTIAAGGSFLPQAESGLPADSDSESVDSLINAPSAPSSVTGTPAVFSFSNLSFGSVTELPGADFPVSDGQQLSINPAPASSMQSFGEPDLTIINPLADAIVESPETSAWMSLPNPLAAPVVQTPAQLNSNATAAPTETQLAVASSDELDLLGINSTPKLGSIQAVLTDYTLKKTIEHPVSDAAGLDQVNSEHILLDALGSAITQPVASDSSISQSPANLTAAYDLSLPEVMPEGTFAPNDGDVTEVSAMSLLFTAQPKLTAENQEDVTALSASAVPGLLRATEFSTATTSSENHTESATAADLLTKGVEPQSTTSNRSAYVNSLIASLLGNTPEALNASTITTDATGKARLIGAGQAASAMDLMQGLQGQVDLLVPTKSSLSDQQMLANITALTSEPSVSSQSASLYNAEQRLQLAAEARQAHLQGSQSLGTPVDTAIARASGTMMAAMEVSFGQTGWAERIGRQILLQSAQGNSTAQIQLDPPELGSLIIKLQLVDQTATVNFTSPHAMVRDALEQQTQRLQEMFREQGMNLLDVSVSDQSANSRQDAERQSAGNGNSPGKQDHPSEQSGPVIIRQSNSLIDYYA